MTLGQLIARLNELCETHGEDTPVRFLYNYGDYWKTTVAAEPTQVDTTMVCHSAYHDMDKESEDSGYSEDKDPTEKMVVAIR